MLFNSFRFMLFVLPVVALAHRLALKFTSARSAQAVLLLATVCFYGWDNPGNLLPLGASILFNFLAATAVSSSREPTTRRRLLILGISFNVLFLGAYKYSRFVSSVIGAFTSIHLPVQHIGLPLGISFFTIQQIMYLVDCYEGISERHGLFDHASFVAFFPYLASGPLVRSRQMIPQFKEERTATAEDIARGLLLLGMGFFKKVVIADCIGRFVDAGYSRVGTLTGMEAWASCLLFCLQIYFDFSGYSDMAIGAGLILGFKIPINFNAPYRSTSIIEFWQRWHITLSQFITTYMYTPLIRSMGRATLVTGSIATMISMAVAGLWHGPAWTFVIFGSIHGVALVLNQVWRKKVKKRMSVYIAWPLTMLVVLVSLAFFRSSSVGAAFLMLKALFFSRQWMGLAAFQRIQLLLVIPVIISAPLAVFGPDSNELARRFTPGYRTALALASLFLVSFLFLNSTIAQEFVYFVF